jgi:tetratricopeptide (TPR) repeat protein
MRHPAKPVLLLILLALVFATGCNKLKARDELNKGVRAYKGGDFETAIEHFQRANDLDPTLLNARIYLATAYATQFVPGAPSEKNKELGEQAIREFEKVLEIDRGNVTALAYIAQLYFGMAGAADWEEARELFAKSKEYRRRLIEVEPTNPEHYYSIGVIDWTLAYRPRMQMKRDLGRRPDEPLPARNRRDLAEQNTAVVEEGIEALQKAVKLNDKYLDAIAYLNLMYREKADIVESPQQREELLTLADEMHERYQRLREELQQAPVAPAS